MSQRTRVGTFLKALGNSGQGKVVPGWGAAPVMGFVGAAFILFLTIMLQVYNQSVLLQGISIDWNSLG